MDEANQQLARAVRAISVLAVLELIAFGVHSVWFDEELAGILNPMVTAVIAAFLLRRRSRTLAITLCLLGVYGLVQVVLQALGIMDPEKTPVWASVVDAVATAALGAWAAVACFRWHIAARTAVVWKNVVVVSLLTAVYSTAALFAGVLVVIAAFGADDETPIATFAVVVLWIGVLVAGFAGALPGTRRRPWAVL